jgi:hypothetical protein
MKKKKRKEKTKKKKDQKEAKSVYGTHSLPRRFPFNLVFNQKYF